jgi:hypothetical protein
MDTSISTPKMIKPVPYNISIREMILKYTPDFDALPKETQDIIHSQVVDDLVGLVKSREIWFPFHKYFRGNPRELFKNITKLQLTISHSPFRLHSYYPKYGTYLAPKFRDSPTLIIGVKNAYEMADVLSDHFIEHIRLKAKRYDQIRSIFECWTDDSCLKEIFRLNLENEYITPNVLRDSFYQNIPETKIFNPTWGVALLELVFNIPKEKLSKKKWLDISAGWGDRLLTAMALDMDYIGYDPNIELRQGHSEMIKMFGNSDRHKVIYEPFETATLPNGPYDVILSSPPYFNLEEYAPNQKGQSIVSYPEFNEWMVNFLFVSLSRAWEKLDIEGYLILHLGDARTIVTCEATNIFIENYLIGASWEGVIGIQPHQGFPRPVWVWKKLTPNDTLINWKSSINNKRNLYNTYPELQIALIEFHVNKYNPDYQKRKNNCISIRTYIYSFLPDININAILADDLMISSLLEKYKTNKTLDFFFDLFKQNPLITKDEINAEVKLLAPFYPTRQTNADNIRLHIRNQIHDLDLQISDIKLIFNDLMISSLLEVLSINNVIIWSLEMIRMTYR